jgi:phospholipid transport system substrate-binding protein
MALSLAVPPWVTTAETKEVPQKDEKAEKKATAENNEQAQSLQEALKAKGEDPGPIDGVIGNKTRTALRGFQKANNLKVTGMLDDQTSEKLGLEKSKLVRDGIFPRFDFQEIAEHSLGAEWYRRSSKEQTEFVKLFTDFLEKAFVRGITSNREKFIYTGERVDEPYAEVDSKLLTPKGEEIKINYMLRRLQSEWKVYDVVVQDVSLVGNYRSQFTRVVGKYSYEELVQRITQKLEALDGKLTKPERN